MRTALGGCPVRRQADRAGRPGSRLVAARLVETALVRDVLATRYKLRSLRSPKFVNRTRDLMQETVRELGIQLAGVQVHPQYSLSARATGPTRRPGIFLGIKTRYDRNRSEDQRDLSGMTGHRR